MSGPVVLALDYPGRRQEARARDLRLEAAGIDVRYLLAPPVPRRLTAAGYAAELVARHGPFEPAPSAVLGYCMAAPIAQEVAAIVGGPGEPAPLVAFDGEPATAAVIHRECRVGLDQFSAQFGAADLPEPPPAFDSAQLSADPEGCVRRMRAALVELAARALRHDMGPGDDLDEEADDLERAAGQMADFYVNWLAHLVAAHNTSWPRWRGEVLHIASRNHAWTGDWPGARATTVRRVAVDRNELLGHAAARDHLLTFLRQAPDAARTEQTGAPA